MTDTDTRQPTEAAKRAVTVQSVNDGLMYLVMVGYSDLSQGFGNREVAEDHADFVARSIDEATGLAKVEEVLEKIAKDGPDHSPENPENDNVDDYIQYGVDWACHRQAIRARQALARLRGENGDSDNAK